MPPGVNVKKRKVTTMHDAERRALRAWMESDGPRALMARVFELGEIGVPDADEPELANDADDADARKAGPHGRTRLALDDADKEARDRLAAWMLELDLEVRVDAVGNLFGVLPAAPGGEPLPPLMLGSHIDTVRNAGPLDGVYGVLAGLTVLQAFRATGALPPRPLIAAAFTNEEGVRYQPDMLGSLVYAGGYPLEKALDTRGIDGSRFGDELERIGYAGSFPPGHVTPYAYLELHVEQGPALDHDKTRIGVVTGVQGISWREVTVEGAANHAGTTPTGLRRDAGLAAARANVFLRDLAARIGGLATVGSVRFEPGQINVIPAKAVFTVDMRDPDADRLAAMNAEFSAYLPVLEKEEGVSISTRTLVDFAPVAFAPGVIERVEAAAERLGLPRRRMVSGAGHDAQMMARICPTGMIFVPSRAGLSHCPQEFTGPEDLKYGALVLLETVMDLLTAVTI